MYNIFTFKGEISISDVYRSLRQKLVWVFEGEFHLHLGSVKLRK